MEQIEFPYKECELGNRIADVQLIEQLKIDNCHLDLDICGTAEKSFLVKEREQDKALRYTVYFSDECILAPMAYFHTELLELTRTVNSKGIKFMGVNVGDAEDPHDHIYLSETSRKYTKVSEIVDRNLFQPVQNNQMLPISYYLNNFFIFLRLVMPTLVTTKEIQIHLKL